MAGQCGSLKISLVFDSELSLLQVKLLAASELETQRTDGPPNPYFRICLAKSDEHGHLQVRTTLKCS